MFRSFPGKRFAIAAILIASLLITLPASAQSNGSAQFATNVPTQVFPKGTLPITRVIYIWAAVGGASTYELQAVQGSTQVVDQLVDASVCVSSTCSVMPAVDLASSVYNWRVRAIIGGVYQTFSPWQSFTIAVPSAGFYSPFTSEKTGWVAHKGAWSLESSNYLITLGVAGKASTISHINDYTTLTFEVRMKRAGCVGCANTLSIRGDPTTLDTTGWWRTEYTFDYTNNGLFSVWKDYYGSYTALKNWTSTTAINQGGWNTLTVTASGSTLKFYINGILVWSGSDSAYPSGRVGIGMYRNSTSTGNKLYVDYAQLTTTVSAAPIANAADQQEEVPGGNKNMAP